MSTAITFIEVDVPVCSLTFACGACTADYDGDLIVGAVPTPDTEGALTAYSTYDTEGSLADFSSYDTEGLLPGGGECYNSLKTCQSRTDYTEETVTVRFGYDGLKQADIDYIPSLKSVSFRPASISLGVDMGVRASLTATMKDHPFAETCECGDRYWRTRGYNPLDRGSYWGKFRARYPFMVGKEIRVIRGYADQSIEAMEARHFIIDSASGPDANGTFTFTGKDILKLADGEKAQCPVISNGRLTSALTSSATSCTLTPTGIGDYEYPASGYVSIGGKEICAYTRSGDTLTITRARFETTAVDHQQNDIVQICKSFGSPDGSGSGSPVDEIISELLTGYAGIPASSINAADWAQECSQYVGRLYSALIPTPTAVKTLVSELIEQVGLAVWVDEINLAVRLQVLRALTTQSDQYTADNVLAGSVSIKDQSDKRLSQVWTYYGQRNPLEKIDEENNFAAAVALIDDEAEFEYGVSSIKKVYSRWIPRFNRPAASDLNYRLLARYRDAPRKVTFAVFRTIDLLPQNAGRYAFSAWSLQDESGQSISIPVQVTELNPSETQISVEAEEITYYDYGLDPVSNDKLVTIDSDAYNVNFRTEYNKAYPEPVSGDVVKCIISAGVKIGSTSPSAYSFIVGEWPAGVSVDVQISSGVYIVGYGGRGGGLQDRDGENGSGAFYSRSTCTVTNHGTIGGGGGGGGAANSGLIGGVGGGGGGAGFPAGAGGDANRDGYAGTLLTGGNGRYGGGDGGDLGQSGESVDPYGNGGTGGNAGFAIDGISYITLTNSGVIAGSIV